MEASRDIPVDRTSLLSYALTEETMRKLDEAIDTEKEDPIPLLYAKYMSLNHSVAEGSKYSILGYRGEHFALGTKTTNTWTLGWITQVFERNALKLTAKFGYDVKADEQSSLNFVQKLNNTALEKIDSISRKLTRTTKYENKSKIYQELIELKNLTNAVADTIAKIGSSYEGKASKELWIAEAQNTRKVTEAASKAAKEIKQSTDELNVAANVAGDFFKNIFNIKKK